MLTAVLAWGLDSFQWLVHSMGQEPEHMMQHLIFAAVSLATAVCMLVESVYQTRRLLALRALLLTISGLWFIAVGFVMTHGWSIIELSDYATKEDMLNDRGNTQHDAMHLPATLTMMANASLFCQLVILVVILGICVFGCASVVLSRRHKISSQQTPNSSDYSIVDGPPVPTAVVRDRPFPSGFCH